MTSHWPADFIEALKLRASNRCECARAFCHDGNAVCRMPLLEETGLARWSPVPQSRPIAEPPDPAEYLAFCGPCAARWMTPD